MSAIECVRCGATSTDPDRWDAEVETGRIFCDHCWPHRRDKVADRTREAVADMLRAYTTETDGFLAEQITQRLAQAGLLTGDKDDLIDDFANVLDHLVNHLLNGGVLDKSEIAKAQRVMKRYEAEKLRLDHSQG